MSQLESSTANIFAGLKENAPSSSRRWPAHWFHYILLAITLAALVPELVLARSEFISYDGFWHLFIDSQNRWRIFLSEYRGDAHPILYHLVLRIVMLFGHSRLVYRSASIIPGVAGVYVLGLAARRLCARETAALLAAAAYGFSIVIIEINIDVRSYPLALFFTIAAFYFLVDFLLDPGERSTRSLLLFSASTSLAIATEYYAIFFFIACLSILSLRLAMDETFRQRLAGLFTAAPGSCAAAFLLPLLVIGFLYETHIRYQPASYGHVAEFYWARTSPAVPFILHNLRADLNALLPVKISSMPVLGAAVVLFAPLLLYFGLFRRQSLRSKAAGVPGLLVLVLLAELIALSLAGRYPFGGFDRQQSIFFPFFILTAFLLLDWAVEHIPSPWLKAAAFACVAILILVNFSYRWRKYPRRSEDLFAQKYNTFQSKVRPAQAVYIDQFTLIGYYSETMTWTWKFRTHFREPDRVDKYDLTSPAGRKLVLLRNIDQWNFDLHKPAVYQILAQSLRDAKLTTANLFLAKQIEDHLDPAGHQAEEELVKKLAANAGLKVTSIYDDSSQADIGFLLDPAQAGPSAETAY